VDAGADVGRVPEPVRRPASPGAPDGVIMRAEAVTKVFPGTVALNEVTFDVHGGRVNVLVGENGAGKSTLMKILAGVEQPTDGRVVLDGEEIDLQSALDASRYGIGMIYQELNLCPNLSVADNIFLGRELVHRGAVDRAAQRRRSRELIQRLEQEIDPDALVSELRIGQQQIVEIAKALVQDVRILIMDEPTSALSASEVELLFRVIRELRSRGVAIVYISHKLDELMQIGDRITVLRDGRVVAHALIADIDVSWIVDRMVGRRQAAALTRTTHATGSPLLRVTDMSLPRVGGGYVVDHVSFELAAGEILGFYGLMGAGRSDLLDCLIGNRSETTGTIWLDGRELRAGPVEDRITAGLVLVPEDRHRDGLVPTLSVAHNMVLASLRRYLKRFFLVKKRERAAVDGLRRELSIRVANADQDISSLSGGNQQKVVVAKGLLTHPKVLMLDEPTRGVDVGAKAEIFELIRRLASEGYGVLFVSSELKEIMAMADRILVMSKGRITAEVAPEDATEQQLVAASAVGHEPAASQNGIGR
jgi:erythritol transport system ATP-binding protein